MINNEERTARHCINRNNNHIHIRTQETLTSYLHLDLSQFRIHYGFSGGFRQVYFNFKLIFKQIKKFADGFGFGFNMNFLHSEFGIVCNPMSECNTSTAQRRTMRMHTSVGVSKRRKMKPLAIDRSQLIRLSFGLIKIIRVIDHAHVC